MFGDIGRVMTEGDVWVPHRQVGNHAFNLICIFCEEKKFRNQKTLNCIESLKFNFHFLFNISDSLNYTKLIGFSEREVELWVQEGRL